MSDKQGPTFVSMTRTDFVLHKPTKVQLRVTNKCADDFIAARNLIGRRVTSFDLERVAGDGWLMTLHLCGESLQLTEIVPDANGDAKP